MHFAQTPWTLALAPGMEKTMKLDLEIQFYGIKAREKKNCWRQSADYIRGCKTQMHYNFIISLKQFFFASHSLASYSIWFLSSLCYFILHFAMWRNCIQFFGANHKRWIHPVHHVHYSIYIFGFVVLSEIDMSEEN